MKPSKRPLFIGITGGIGAGKSEILKYLQEHYPCEIYLADQVGHLVKEPGTDCYRALVKLLGEEILEPDGRIDRPVMAAKIFSDEKLLEQVNAIVHPAVRKYLLERYERARAEAQVMFFFVEAALLIEAGYGELVDQLWYIYAPPGVREQRLRESRGYSEERIRNVMERQLSEEEFRASCDFVIDNSGTLEETFRQIDERLAGG